MAGCGNGGRLGLVAARRHPDRYDGILAGAPALHWPRAALQHAWDWQQWRQVSDDPREALSTAQLGFIARKVRERCDAMDLLEDGQVNDVARCQQRFPWESLQCKPGGSAEACLDATQLQSLRFAMAGPHDAKANALYVDWPLDPGIASLGWRHWRLRSDVPGWDHQPVAATVGAAALAHVFSTPPQPVAGSIEALEAFLLNYDWAAGPDGLWNVAAPFDRSAMGLLSPSDDDAPRLDGWYEYGGKLLIYHGSADPAFSVKATTRWVERLQSHHGLARAQTGMRAFVVPGMGHCSAGPATDRFDALGALVDWVERGQAPERIEASVRPDNPDVPSNWSPTRTRPLCPWPLVARYRGGDAEQARSFSCSR
jgi:feruloyl esterase